MTIRVVDLSAYTGEVQDADWQYLWDAGVRGAIVQAYGGRPERPGQLGTGKNPHAQQQLVGAERRGMHLAAYTWPSWHWPAALDNLGPYAQKIQFLALDVEARAPVHPDQIADLRDRGVEPLIYTSSSQWQDIMGGNPHQLWFAANGVGLWAAYYPHRIWNGVWPTNVQEGMRYPVPSWGICEGWQFAGTTTLSDETWDLNIFEDDVFAPMPDPEPDPEPDDPNSALLIEIAELREQRNRYLQELVDKENLAAQTLVLNKSVSEALKKLAGR